MLRPFYNEEQVNIGTTEEPEILTLVFNFRAIDAIETLTGEQMDAVAREVLSGEPRLSVTGKVLWGLLREQHSDATLDQAAGLMFDKERSVPVGLAMGQLLLRAFNIETKAKDENPPKRRGASKPS
jgi:hypothetical protein